MSVSAISSGATPTPAPLSQRTQEDVAGRQLIQALKSGNLDAAQQAYNTLAAFGPNDSGPFGASARTQDFQALGQAIQSGDLAGAQQAAHALASSQLNQDVIQARQDYSSGGYAGSKNAIENLSGDYWAVYGQALNVPKEPPVPTANPAATNASLNIKG